MSNESTTIIEDVVDVDLATETGASGLYLRVDSGDEARIRIVGGPIKWTEKYDNGDRATKYAFLVIHKEADGDTVSKVVKGFKCSWGVVKHIQKYTQDSDFGDPSRYDIVVSRDGEGIKTKWSVIAKPPKPLTDDDEELVREANLDLRAMYTGESQLQKDAEEVFRGKKDPFED